LTTPYVHTLGPAHIFVRFRGESTALYLGTSETAPRIDKDPLALEVKNDLSSRQAPFQLVDDGEVHSYTTVLTRYDYAVMKRVLDRYYHTGAVATMGRDDRFKRGSLVLGIGDFQLVHVNDFTGVSPTHPLALPEQPAGRLYYSAVVSKAAEDAGATRAVFQPISFACNAVYDPNTRVFGLFTEDPSAFGSLAPIT
jgi:hypothetical protein